MTHSFITEWDNTPKTKMRFSREVSFAELQRVTNCMAKHEIPSIEDFIWVLKEAAKVLSTLPNNVHVIPEPNDRLIFVGDLHGCFETLIRLFLGYPQQNIPRTGFPGEIVDGRRLVYFSTETLLTEEGLDIRLSSSWRTWQLPALVRAI